MKKLPTFLLILAAGFLTLFGQSASGPVDFQKARELIQRQKQGQTLTPEELAYVQRAREARAEQARSADSAKASNQRKAPERLLPLCDMTATDRYEGEDGGLYGGGMNVPPDKHRQTASAQLARIQPLDAAGKPSGDGLIGFVSISMSNATQEFSRFKQIADPSPLKSKRVAIVDCAQGGMDVSKWAPADSPTWSEARRRLEAAKVSPQQVQVAWIKPANRVPTGSLLEHGKKLEADTLAVVHNARKFFPNLKVVYFSSRTYGGYGKTEANPEPYAYEGAFVVRWLIQRQIKGDPELAEAKAPLLLWGPYLWAEGTKGRKMDELTWERGDFVEDGVHPSMPAGRDKVARLLLKFLSEDPLAKTWFAGP